MDEVQEYAYEFRRAIEEARDAGDFTRDICFGSFPVACCGDACCLLGHYLLEHGINTKYVCGNYYADNDGNGQSHAWLLLDNRIIIDITGDQFKYNPIFLNYDEPVFVGIQDEFHRLFEVESRDVWDSSYIENLGGPCIHRLKKLYSSIISRI